ncbi:MAG TPA: hypothetical protein VFN57_10710 [Thermomicrobiaceae bacterium]|nr:hypothetical protein [Thermomicrobiaceae bacterium]
MSRNPIAPRAPRGLLAVVLTLLASAALLLGACGGGSTTSAAGSTAVPTTAPAYTATLALSPEHAKPGATITVTGSKYPAGASVDLVWHSVKGHYELTGGTEFVGARFDDTSKVLTTVKADAAGNISTQITMPGNDFGGEHDVRGRVNGTEISQAALTMDPVVTMTPGSGAIGAPITLTIEGVDWRSTIDTWHVLYDNKYLGFMSAVTTQGTAVAHFRAAGPVGMHEVSVWHNSYYPTPYLNWQQGPNKSIPDFDFAFNVTADPGASAPVVEDFTATDNPWPTNLKTPGTLTLTPDRGTVGATTTIKGSGLPANADLSLRYYTEVGNRVTPSGFSEQAVELGTVHTDASGTFSKATTIPADLGGQHLYEVYQGSTVLAAANLVIEPSVLSVSATSVKVGQTITIHLKGVGWTTYDNTYAVTYDDSYIGYVCGFSTAGDISFKITATGGAGTHIIDLYPTIYKGQDAKPNVYSIPQLTYQTDHPQRLTPAIRLSIEVTN